MAHLARPTQIKPMLPVVYFRASLADSEEFDAAREHFRVVTQRTHVRAGELAIPRYSALPFNNELCCDLVELGATPINTYRQHCYVADLRNWYYDLGDITPRTWFALDEIPRNGGPFVLKGATNSRKHLWSTHMFAQDWNAARDVYLRLAEDTTIGAQPIYIRQYVPLKCLATGLNQLPITEEYRFFVLDGQIVGSGFYWNVYADELDRVYTSEAVPRNFLQRVIDLVAPQIRFWVCDIATTADDRWIVVELNDGQQSGLTGIEPKSFYSELRRILSLDSTNH